MWHRHADFYELVLVVDGTFWDEYPGGSDMLRSGNFFVYAPGTVHHYRQMRNSRYYNVLFAADFEDYTPLRRKSLPPGLEKLLPGAPERSPVFSLGDRGLAEAAAVAEEMCREQMMRQTGWREMQASRLVGLLIQLLRSSETPGPEESASLAFTMGNVVDFMEKHMLDDLTLPQLARYAAMSESSFRHRFRESTGFPPLRFLLILRLKYALNMLFLGRDAAKCARLAGFRDSSHFGRIFKKYLGLSPRDAGRLLAQDNANLELLTRRLTGNIR